MATPVTMKPARAKSDKEKERRQSQLQATDRLKVVIRRLPPNLPEEIFWQSVQLWVSDETTSWKAYYLGKLRKKLNKENISSRAYIAFKNEELLAVFSREYDGHVFRDKNGLEYQAVVEFAPYPKIPSEKKKLDNRNATIEKDDDFISFLELLKATENAEPVSLDTLIAATQVAPAPKTTPLLEALKAEKSAARDKEAILRNHAHYKQVETTARKEDKKKGINAPSGTPAKGLDPPANRKSSRKAHAQQQAQVQAAAAAAVQAAAINPAKSTQIPKGATSGGAGPSSRPPRPPKPPRVAQPPKGPHTAPANPALATSDAPTPSASTSTAATTGSAPTDPTPASRRSRPLIGIASRQFEAALSIAGLANSASERKRRERERESQANTPIIGPTAEAAAKDDSKPARPPGASSLNLPAARIDESDNEQEKETQGPKVPGPSPRKDRSRRGGRGGASVGGGGRHALEGSSAPPKVLGTAQRNDAPTPAAPVIIQRPTSGAGAGSSVAPASVVLPPSIVSGGGGPPGRGRRGRGSGRGRGGVPGGPRGGG